MDFFHRLRNGKWAGSSSWAGGPSIRPKGAGMWADLQWRANRALDGFAVELAKSVSTALGSGLR
jgi:hypothetical protein